MIPERKSEEGRIVSLALTLLIVFAMNAHASVMITPSLPQPVTYLCGAYENTSVIRLPPVRNLGNDTLYNLVARLVVQPSGLLVIPDGNISLGNLDAGAYSALMPEWQLACRDDMTGAYALSVQYSGANFSEQSGVLGVAVVLASAPRVVFSQPAGLSSAAISSIEVVTDKAAVCRLGESDADFAALPTFMAGSEKSHTMPLRLPDGNYRYYVRCADRYNATMASPYVVDFALDTIPPGIGYHASQDPATGVVYVNVSTSEAATCRYSLSSAGFDAMASFFSGSSAAHYAQLSLADGEYSLHIGCRDVAGNTGVLDAPLSVDAAPTAEISLGLDAQRLKEGIIEVSVTTSKEVIQAPKLLYTFDNTDTRKSVSLEGAGRNWKGYMIVGAQSNELIGSFEYAATDRKGTAGSVISKGKLFIVDTLPPPAPRDVYAQRGDGGRVLLRWSYSGESTSGFNIYRSTGQYVGYAHYLTTVSSISFTDKVNESADAYYYRVSALDAARNEGELSTEVNVTFNMSLAHDEQLSDGSVRKVYLSPDSLALVDQLIRKAERSEMDLTYSAKDLAKGSALELEIVSQLELSRQARDSLEGINLLLNELGAMRYVELQDDVVRSRVLGMEGELARAIRNTPVGIAVSVDSESVEQLQRTDLQKVFDELPLAGWDSATTRNYQDASESLSISSSINQQITRFLVSYGDGNVRDMVRIRESPGAGYSSSQADGATRIVVERIPKGWVASAQDILFVTPPSYVLKDDPVVRFDTGSLVSGGITYFMNATSVSGQAERIVTAVIYDYDVWNAQRGNAQKSPGIGLPTGGALFPVQGLSLSSTELAMLMIGVVLLAVLVGYYLVFVRRVFREPIDQDQWHDEVAGAEKEIEAMNKLKGEDIPLSSSLGSTTEKKTPAQPAAADTRPSTTPPTQPGSQQMPEHAQFIASMDSIDRKIASNALADAVEEYKLLMERYKTLPKTVKTAVYARSMLMHKKLVTLHMFEEK